MKNVSKWLLGFAAGVFITVIGLALIMLLAQLAFTYLNFWLVIIFCIIPLFLAVYKTLDYSLVLIPYHKIKNRSISLYYVLALFVILFAIANLLDSNSSNKFASVPNWFWMVVNGILVLGSITSAKPVSQWLKEVKIFDELY